MRRNIIYVLRLWSAALAVALLVWVGNASADNASFNCSMARGLIEKTICDSAKLSELDHQLDAAYRMAQSAPGIDKVALLFDQRDWLRERDAECSTDYAPAGKSATTSDDATSWHELCLQESYFSRLGALRSPPRVNDALCKGISDHLPPTGSRIAAPKTVLDFFETGPQPVFVIGGDDVDGYSLESQYEGSLGCQTNKLYRQTRKGKSVFPLPEGYEGGEGEFCGGDAIHLVSLNGAPAVLEDVEQGQGMESNGAKITLKVLQNGLWSHACAIRILTKPNYKIKDQFCSSPICKDLSLIAPLFSNEWHARSGVLDTTGKNLSASERKLYEQLKDVAGPAQAEDSLQLGVKGNQANEYQFSGSFLLPVKVKGEIFLGKLGPSGEGNRSGTADLLAIYRLVGAELKLVAGFYLDVDSLTLTSIRVTTSR